MATEQDSVWKEVLDNYFQEFMAFFFPHIHADIKRAAGITELEVAFSPNAVRAQLYSSTNPEPVSVHRLADTVAQ